MTVPAYMPFGGPQRASEEDARARPPDTLVSPGVRLLAAAMIEAAWQDLHDSHEQRSRSYWSWIQKTDYRPEAETARDWFNSMSDRPRRHLPFVLCCQALRLDPEAVRAACFARAPVRLQGRPKSDRSDPCA